MGLRWRGYWIPNPPDPYLTGDQVAFGAGTYQSNVSGNVATPGVDDSWTDMDEVGGGGQAAPPSGPSGPIDESFVINLLNDLASKRQKVTIVVAADGTGDFTTIGAGLAAAGAVGGASVFVKRGIYGAGEAFPLAPPTNTDLFGEGDATLIRVPNATNLDAIRISNTASNVSVRNLMIDGNKAGQTVKCHGIIAGPPSTTGVDNVRVVGCHVINANGYNIVGVGGTHLLFARNIVEGSNEEGLEFQNCSNSSMVGNIVRSAGMNGILVWGGGGTPSSVTVTGNTVDGHSARLSGFAAIRVDDGITDVSVTANVVNGGGTSAVGIAVISSTATSVKGIVVSGNTVNASPANGIIVGNQVEGATVVANNVRNPISHGIVVQGANTGRVTVGSNTIRGAGGEGVKVDSLPTNAVWAVMGNVIFQCINNGILVNSSTRGVVIGNLLSNNTLKGVSTTGTSDNVVITGNTNVNNADATDDIHFVGNNNVVANNIGRVFNKGPIAPPAVPATTVAQTNTFGVPMTVFVNGGTVSAVAIGGTATGQTSGAFRVPPGQTITLTYTVAPTWTWFGD